MFEEGQSGSHFKAQATGSSQPRVEVQGGLELTPTVEAHVTEENHAEELHETVHETEAQTETPAEETKVEVKPKYTASQQIKLYKGLRASDPPGKQTCRKCFKRVPLAEIRGGYSDNCDSCN